jgi:hypothetical protein
LFYSYYKKLRSDLFDFAFKEDAVMIKAAEHALATLMDSPLKFGAMCTEARNEVWRFTRPWPRMLADHINSILTMDWQPATTQDDIYDALNLIALLSNKIAFVNYHKRHLAKRILGHLRGFDMELERFVVSSLLHLGCPSELLQPISRLLEDYKVFDSSSFLIGEDGVGGGGGGRGGSDGDGGGGGGGVDGDGVGGSLIKAPPFDFDIRYLSKSAWQGSGVW